MSTRKNQLGNRYSLLLQLLELDPAGPLPLPGTFLPGMGDYEFFPPEERIVIPRRRLNRIDGATDLPAEDWLGHRVSALPLVDHDIAGHQLPLVRVDPGRLLKFHVTSKLDLFERDDQGFDQVLPVLARHRELQLLGTLERNHIRRHEAPD